VEKNKDFYRKSNVKKSLNNFIDEATSSLDAETEVKIQEALNF
jgi:ABC-type multidrug transport system fused ATPase/permease subunit